MSMFPGRRASDGRRAYIDTTDEEISYYTDESPENRMLQKLLSRMNDVSSNLFPIHRQPRCIEFNTQHFSFFLHVCGDCTSTRHRRPEASVRIEASLLLSLGVDDHNGVFYTGSVHTQ